MADVVGLESLSEMRVAVRGILALRTGEYGMVSAGDYAGMGGIVLGLTVAKRLAPSSRLSRTGRYRRQ